MFYILVNLGNVLCLYLLQQSPYVALALLLFQNSIKHSVLSNANFGVGYKGTGAQTALFATL